MGRSQTLGEAGRALGVDGSTVSRRLTALEGALGSTLFERGRAGVRPTEAVRALLPIAEEIEHAMARFRGAAEAFESEVSGTVRITCPPDAAEVLLVPLLPELRRRHPGLQVELDATEDLRDVARRAADLALRIVRPREGELVARRLRTIRWVPAASPAQVRRWGPLDRWDAVPWIAHDRLEASPTARWLAERLPGSTPALRSDSTRVQAAAAAAGLGAVVLPEPNLAPFGLAPLELRPHLAAEAPSWPAMPLYAVTHRALRAVPRVRAVWAFLNESVTD